MTPLHSLWLPIVLSAVAVFVISAAIHMGTPWHRRDYPPMPNEDRFREAVRPLAVPPGDYMVPCAGHPSELRSAAFIAKLDEGPVAVLTVFPNGRQGMGRSLVLWFLYALAIGVFAGYVAGRALPPGSAYRHVFRFAGATAFLGYTAALWQMSIWYRRGWGITLRSTADGIAYAIVTAGMFGWLWPR